jgi:hypothetical protein
VTRPQGPVVLSSLEERSRVRDPELPQLGPLPPPREAPAPCSSMARRLRFARPPAPHPLWTILGTEERRRHSVTTYSASTCPTYTSGSTRKPLTASLYQYPELLGDHARVFLS